MNRLVLFALGAMLALVRLASAESVTFDWAYVGNAGNAPDPVNGLGAVPYNYAISKTEVTNAQYAAFLNSVDPKGTNELGLYEGNPFFSPNDGIELTDESTPDAVDGHRYVVVPGFQNRPVINVSLESATRFANWLHNGQLSGDTENGSYSLDQLDPVLSPFGATRNQGARYWAPSDDEWYKAAFHDASAGLDGNYFEYANSSNTPPVSDHPDDDPSAANYYDDDGIDNGFNDGSAILRRPFAGIESRIPPYALADVGSYFNAVSPYGTLDQNGNVAEWTESRYFYAAPTPWAPRHSSTSFTTRLSASSEAGIGFDFTVLSRNMGFRVATIPEPTGWVFVAIGLGFTATCARRA